MLYEKWNHLVANINAVVSGLFSLSLNGFIIVVILKGKSTSTGYYKWIIISTAIFDVTFSAINAFACPVSGFSRMPGTEKLSSLQHSRHDRVVRRRGV
ncbi:unnamed protein product [Haemonchus placei]|uniref:G_PROTEIN_RECEP_F1_2 domain-containing protein n=1 Tax=Haemonchus placei TaxID=6290 RepID=A0A0N4W7S2_HAEPC|nr:unnamed protein product [Haemonchus placei]